MYVIKDGYGNRFVLDDKQWHTFAGLVRMAELRDMKQ
jgi:hypothetical protein